MFFQDSLLKKTPLRPILASTVGVHLSDLTLFQPLSLFLDPVHPQAVGSHRAVRLSLPSPVLEENHLVKTSLL